MATIGIEPKEVRSLKKSALRKRSVSKGFTLVELLVVIAIIAVLAIIMGVVINPIEIFKNGRDSTRLADMASLQQAINVAAQEATASGTDILCNGVEAPCTESSFPLGANTRKTDATGWVKVNLSAQKSVSVPALPVDPTNNNTYKYTYYSDGNTWKMTVVLESEKNLDKMKNDGGTNDAAWEVGSNLALPI